MIEKGQVINILPPILDDNIASDKRRYMIILYKDNEYIDLINVSSVKGKEHKLLRRENYRLTDFTPFKEPSFAKTDTAYRMENFPEIESYISFAGKK